ncbi:hypothetical protein PN466_20905 [Roseofilum reptotaenium CS-1145]|uniref:Uncharacterized protein n=1 Tax=Roseofilum reptotaenium AO1-A TaxID=1925591 RepID=A0A1L9QKY5_9CYAN|nr:hypothetical protein [Roseofilum reptotaenium]MDB9519407.1 hypothetical protein [Roseofilum reptotaenium CS-1145]OJJ18376.1 hypothetical protein BI308_22335 [Roseofilum reptotaenium AO1-A]
MCLLQDFGLSSDTLDVFRQVVESADSRSGIRFIRYYARNDKSKFGQALNNLVRFLIDCRNQPWDFRWRKALEDQPMLKTTFLSILGFTCDNFATYKIDDLELPKQLIYSCAASEFADLGWDSSRIDDMFWYQGFNQQSFREWFDFEFQRQLQESENSIVRDIHLSFYDRLDRLLFPDSEQEIFIYNPASNENVDFSPKVIIGKTCIIVMGIEYDL